MTIAQTHYKVGYTMGHYKYKHGEYEHHAEVSDPFNLGMGNKRNSCWNEEPEKLAYWQSFFANKYRGREKEINEDRLYLLG